MTRTESPDRQLMTTQRFDWRLVIVLIVASVVFVAAVLIVHRWQWNTRPRQETTVRTSMPR